MKNTFGNPLSDILSSFLQETIVNKKSYIEIENVQDEIFSPEKIKILIDKFINNPDESNSDFETKVQNQFKDNVDVDAKAVFANIMWLRYLFPEKTGNENNYGVNQIKKIQRCTNLTLINKSYPTNNGCAPYGPALRKLRNEIVDLILLFQNLLENYGKQNEQENNDDILANIKKYIIRWCLDLPLENVKYDKGNGIRTKVYNDIFKDNYAEKIPFSPIHNMLLYACDPKHYDNIAVSSDKISICAAFNGLVNEESKDEFLDGKDEYNKTIFLIYKKLGGNTEDPLSFSDIYSEKYRSLWKIDIDQSEALKFKKALILYGPPGTSKTYTSTKLAENLIYQLNYQTNKKEDTNLGIEQYFKDLTNGTIKKHIHRLQLHPNYTYEDFIWGYQIENEKYDEDGNIGQSEKKFQCVGSKTTPKKGYFLRLLDEIQKENQRVINKINKLKKQTGKETEISKKEKELKVHVLILDEINRVDLSRLFGELFSAIENRDESVDLPVEVEGVSKISVPKNLYIIGTMNEIDFSLERVDFALRRRFLWKFYGFNDQALYDILNEKQKKYGITKMDNESIIDYYDRCKALNDAINKDDDLGKQYEIGHTFFGEIIDLWVSLGTGKHLKTIQEKLWEVSIGPMIEAYLGNCDAKTKKEKIDTLKSAFILEKDGE